MFGLLPSNPCNGILGCIGNTPLIKIESLSRETGCEVGVEFFSRSRQRGEQHPWLHQRLLYKCTNHNDRVTRCMAKPSS